jgi:hypothetical protein
MLQLIQQLTGINTVRKTRTTRVGTTCLFIGGMFLTFVPSLS